MKSFLKFTTTIIVLTLFASMEASALPHPQVPNIAEITIRSAEGDQVGTTSGKNDPTPDNTGNGYYGVRMNVRAVDFGTGNSLIARQGFGPPPPVVR